MAACSNPPGPQAPSTMTPVLAVEKIPWNFTGEAETTSAGVQLAWHAIDLGSDYTTVVYSLHAASAAAVAGPPQLAQAWLRLDEGVTLESIACAAPTDCLGVTIGAVQFPGRSAPAAFLELKINELRAGETTLTGEWRLRPLVNADPASDRISGAYVFPRPEVLHSDGVAIVYGFDGRAPVADGSSPGGAFPFISPLPLAPDAAQPGQPAATATPAPRRRRCDAYLVAGGTEQRPGLCCHHRYRPGWSRAASSADDARGRGLAAGWPGRDSLANC